MNKIFSFKKRTKAGEDCNKYSKSVSYETLVGGTPTAGSAYEQTQSLSKGNASAPLDAAGTFSAAPRAASKVVEKSLHRHSEPQAKNPEKTKTVIPDLIGYLSRFLFILIRRSLEFFAFAQVATAKNRDDTLLFLASPGTRFSEIATSEPVALPRNDTPLFATSALKPPRNDDSYPCPSSYFSYRV